MFIFGKREKTNHDIILLKKICEKLPEKYDFLKKQVNDGIILDVNRTKQLIIYDKNDIPVLYDPVLLKKESGCCQIVFNNTLLKKYFKKPFRDYTIEDIIVKQKNNDDKVNVQLLVSYGVLVGCFIKKTIKSFTIDLESIDMDNVKEKYIMDESTWKSRKKLFSEEELRYINLEEVNEVEFNGKIYYSIFELEDGDFIGMDKKKHLYEITHDPYEITPIKETLIEYIKNNRVRRHVI
jgi:hypothetical protein